MKFYSYILVLFLVGCAAGSTTSADRTTNSEEVARIISSVTEGTLVMEMEWAYPVGGSQVNLIGTPNHLTFKDGTVTAALPYFGERHAGTIYTRDGGVQFKGVPKALEIKESVKKGTQVIEFDIREQGELYDVRIMFYDNLTCSVYVVSTQRESIQYDGRVVRSKE